MNLISVCAAVTDWCYQFGLTDEEKKKQVAIPVYNRILTMVEPEEVEMLVSSLNLALGNKMPRSASFRVLEKRIQMAQLCDKVLFQHLVTAGNLVMKTDGKNYSSMPRIFKFSRYCPKTPALAAFATNTIIGPVLEVHTVKMHDGYALEVAIQLICRPKDTSYVVISRETERCVNEIHDHKAEVGSRNEMLENLQESERNEPYEERKVTTRSKETWAAPSMKETRAGSLSLFLRKASQNTRRTIPTSEKIWKTIHTNVSQGRHLAVSISKTVSTMLRDFDQDERQTDGQDSNQNVCI